MDDCLQCEFLEKCKNPKTTVYIQEKFCPHIQKNVYNPVIEQWAKDHKKELKK